jgi:hypothetical protein
VNQGEAEELAKRLLGALEKNSHSPAQAGDRMMLEAAEGAGKRLQQLMGRTPWEFIPPGWLDEIQAAFDPVVAQIESYATQEDGSEHTMSWTEIGRMWNSLTPLVAASIPEESVSEDAVSFRRSAGQLLRHLNDEIEESESRATGLQSRLAELETARTAEVSAFRTTIETLTATINEQSARLEQAIRANQEQFSASQDRHRQEFADELEEVRLSRPVES